MFFVGKSLKSRLFFWQIDFFSKMKCLIEKYASIVDFMSNMFYVNYLYFRMYYQLKLVLSFLRSIFAKFATPRGPYSLHSLFIFPGHLLSMGYGFVEFKKRSDALKAIRELQVCVKPCGLTVDQLNKLRFFF